MKMKEQMNKRGKMKMKKEDIETGVAKGIDKTGALLVEVDGQTKRVVSGEVSVRGLYGYV